MDGTHHLAERLARDEAAAREIFEQLASVVSIQESIGAQRRMDVLTYVEIVVAAASLAAAIEPPKECWSDIKTWYAGGKARVEAHHRR